MLGWLSAIALISSKLADAGGDRHHRDDARGLGAGDEPGAVGGELGKVQMAMVVDEHERVLGDRAST